MSNPQDNPTLTNPAAGASADAPADTTRGFEPGSPSAPMPTDGTERYELLGSIARGGMGEVCAAYDRMFRREVAIKVLRTDLQSRTHVAARFLDEARITGQLQHPGVPPVHDIGTLSDGRPFIAMKLIKGKTLADYLTEDKPGPSRVLVIFEQIAQTVAFAHSRRVVHRDLKPANVMVGRFGEVQVMDWGLAKVLAEPGVVVGADEATGDVRATMTGIDSDRAAGGETQAGSVMGTPAFMPPEQAIGAIDQIDARSDVFGLGAILCVMLTGQPPFVAATAESTRQLSARGKLDDAFARLDAVDADPELVALGKWCLAAEKADRPADAAKVAEAVAALRAGAEERVRRAELDRVRAEGDLQAAGIKAAEEHKRRRIQLALAATGVLLVAVGGAAAWWQDRQASERRAEQELAAKEKDRLEQQRVSDLARIEAERKTEAMRQQVEDEKRTQDERDRRSRNAQAVEALLAQCEEALRGHDSERAAFPLAQIDKRLGEGGAEALQTRIDGCRADLTILRALDATDEASWGAEDYKLRAKRASEGWAKAFADYGIVLETTPVPDAVRRVTGSRLRERLQQSLDLWHLYSPADRRRDLRKIIDAVDPDPFRIEVRDAIQRSDRGWNEALVEDNRAFQQPAWFAAVWGQATGFPAAAREKILRQAIDRSPGDFSLLMTMVMILESTTAFRTETATQQLRWAQAIVSVRPRSKIGWRSLGRAHWDRGQLADAVAAYRRACRLDPADYNSLSQLSAVLLRTHDPEAALEAAQKAIALRADYSYAHANVGSVLQRMGRYREALAAFDRAIECDLANGVETAHNHNNRGFTRLRLGNLDGAISDFREALRINPSLSLAQTNLSYARELRDNGVTPEPAPPPREK